MTDLEKFIDLYKSFGIDLSDQAISDKDEEYDIWIYPHNYYGTIKGSEKIEGYIGFYTVITFDKDGKFKNQLCAE